MTTNIFKRTTLAIGFALMAPLAAWSQISVSIGIAPPPLPLYAQPPIPGDGYLWTPGYWQWDPSDGDYNWVPGTWVLPPGSGMLWTPGYWAFGGGGYLWHGGYWGTSVGYYGGLNYGFGYNGSGYWGGRWDHGHFRYNQSVNNLPQGRVRNVYNTPVAQRPAPRDSYNGGNSHYRTQPTAAQRRIQGTPNPTPAQVDHEQRAMKMPEQRMANNHGAPPTAATPRPGGFGDPQVEHVRQAPEARAQPARPQGQPARNGGGKPEGGDRR